MGVVSPFVTFKKIILKLDQFLTMHRLSPQKSNNTFVGVWCCFLAPSRLLKSPFSIQASFVLFVFFLLFVFFWGGGWSLFALHSKD